MCMDIHEKQEPVLRDGGGGSAGLPVQPVWTMPDGPGSAAGERRHEPDTSGTPGGIADEAVSREDVEACGYCCHRRKLEEEARDRAARERADRYLAELIEEVGGLTPEGTAEAEAWWNPVRPGLQAGDPR